MQKTYQRRRTVLAARGDAQAYLEEARTLAREIEAKLAQKSELMVLSQRLIASYDGVRISGGGDEQRPTERLALLGEEIGKDVARLVTRRREIAAHIEVLSDPLCRELLTYRYLACMPTWEDVATRMGYSTRNVLRLHARALLLFEATHGSTGYTYSV